MAARSPDAVFQRIHDAALARERAPAAQPPAWLTRTFPQAAQRPDPITERVVNSRAFKVYFGIVGVGLVILIFGAIAGSAGWAGTMLLAHAFSRRANIGVALMALVVLGCSEPDWATTLGMLNPTAGDRSVALTRPTHVTANAPFLVTVQTFGSSTCTRPDRLDLTVTGSLARLAPYDQVAQDGATCTRDLAPFSHARTVTFGEAGPASLRIVGYFGQDGDAVLDSVDMGVEVEP
ncbi:MAG TPA: hypothetical protein VJQ46_07400 [Gemmatimonadales bacterium]|nr:hypothetical protein [Gemmatimonadales bacterium]